MKINAKLFLLVLSIITLISITSATIYHILAQQLLQSQQSKNLVNSANDFIFAYQNFIAKMDDDFNAYINQELRKIKIEELDYIDFLFSVKSDSTIEKASILSAKNTNIFFDVVSLKDFLAFNTNLLIRKVEIKNTSIYYGAQIDSKIINKWSEKIRAEIALVEENVVTKYSNTNSNQYYLPILSKMTRELKNRNNFELVFETQDGVDFSATHYKTVSAIAYHKPIGFLIFNVSKEASAFKNTMNLVTVIIVISAIMLSIVFLFLFTAKFRKQIQFISEVINTITTSGKKQRVKVITNDEIGSLAHAFNNMLDEIERKDSAEKEYGELISIINKNPDLEAIGNAALRKIIDATNVDAGTFYLFEESRFKPFASEGLSQNNKNIDVESSFYKKALENKNLTEIRFNENKPVIRTGMIELEINYLYILPIFYNAELIAILELASVNKPVIPVENYLSRITDQLAIGIANSKSLRKLKNLVSELQKLNSAYQVQNLEITEKNKELTVLHEKLKKGAVELEIQTKKAVESEHIKSQFLANISHELRTPQNSILGLTELILKDESINPKTRARLNVVLRNGKKLLNLIENILEYSKLEAGYEEVKKSKIFLSELVTEINNFVSPLFLEGKSTFSIHYPEDIDYEIFSDIKKLEQIIINLISNAAKFTDSGFVRLELLVENDCLKIIVEDSGTGISEADKEIIFNEFRQADGNLNRKFSGTGLGLAICKRYAELLQAEIKLESTVGKGSKFIVELQSVISSITELSKINNTQSENPKFYSLILSDGNHSADLIRDYLKSYSISVEVKTSKELKIDNLKSKLPDIIVLDILFDNKNGWSSLVRLKTDPILSRVPIMIVNMDEEANCGWGLNISEYFCETIDNTKLNNIMRIIESKNNKKINRVFTLLDDQKFERFQDEFIHDNLHVKNLKLGNEHSQIDDIINFYPDLIIADIFLDKFNIFGLLDEINMNNILRGIPIIGLLENSLSENKSNTLNNNLIETTLIKQYHPLDILKIIRERINIINSHIFNEDKMVIPQYLNAQKEASQLKNHKKSKILIVDDNADTRYTIGEIVESLGYTSDFAEDGFECLNKLNDYFPDLVLLDIMMPKMDGFQTIKEIRKQDRFENLSVYALTAYAMLSDKEIIEKNGFNGLITKPINTVQLERKLNQILKILVNEN